MGCFIVAIVETIKTIMTEYFNFFSKTFIQIKTIHKISQFLCHITNSILHNLSVFVQIPLKF